MAEYRPSKPSMRVRFPSPAPINLNPKWKHRVKGIEARAATGGEAGLEDLSADKYRKAIPKTENYIQLSSGDKLVKEIEREGGRGN